MNYRTTCPQCASVFRLGADQLDAAQGWVQCSVCGTAFDARTSLLLEDGSPLPRMSEAEPEQPATAPEPAPIPDEPAPEPAARAEDAPVEDVPVAEAPRGIVQRDASLDLPSIILIDPDVSAPDDPGPLPHFQPPPAYPRPPAAPAEPFVPLAPAPPPPPAARVEYAAPPPGRARTRSARWRVSGWVWAVASVVLLVVLLAQTAYFLRDALASRLPQTRPALEQACAALGCTLSLPKNLALLQVVGSDLQTEAPARGTPAGAPLLRSDPSAAGGRLKLVLTLGNRAAQAQAWPVLILTLTDQRSRPLARRSFAPSEYLGDPERIAAGIPPRSEQALTLPLSVRDLTPMGFSVELTY